jgi:hypothetical protein
VPDVLAAQAEVLNAGGAAVGDIVTLQTAAGARVTWCYVRDPGGNAIELQSWSQLDSFADVYQGEAAGDSCTQGRTGVSPCLGH